jgi:copper oxidase (laccase) domain-containing protein
MTVVDADEVTAAAEADEVTAVEEAVVDVTEVVGVMVVVMDAVGDVDVVAAEGPRTRMSSMSRTSLPFHLCKRRNKDVGNIWAGWNGIVLFLESEIIPFCDLFVAVEMCAWI